MISFQEHDSQFFSLMKQPECLIKYADEQQFSEPSLIHH